MLLGLPESLCVAAVAAAVLLPTPLHHRPSELRFPNRKTHSLHLLERQAPRDMGYCMRSMGLPAGTVFSPLMLELKWGHLLKASETQQPPAWKGGLCVHMCVYVGVLLSE